MVQVMEMDDHAKHSGVREEEIDDIGDEKKRYNDMRDRGDMDRLGKKQELKRNFRLLNIFSFMCVAMSSWVFVIK